MAETDPRSAIRNRALATGFDAVGFAPAKLHDLAGERLRQFLDAGYHGEMGWLADRVVERSQPQSLWPDARSVIVLGLNYAPDHDPMEALRHADQGAVSVYAQGRDYHDVVKKRLRVLARWIAESFATEVKLFVDTAPVLEKPLAQSAGLGWQGKHTNLVSRAFGSWLFLGEIFTALDLAPDTPSSDHCGGCSACLDACPTAAFPAPYHLDARRCISYLTIEHKGPIPHEFRAHIGNRIYGCDDCLAVCPWNKFAQPHGVAEFRSTRASALAAFAALDDVAFRARFSGSPIKRIGRDRFLRNVLIAIGNSGEASLIDRVESLIEDTSPLVRGAAIWALFRLAPQRAAVLRHQFEAGEDEPMVVSEWQACAADAGMPARHR